MQRKPETRLVAQVQGFAYWAADIAYLVRPDSLDLKAVLQKSRRIAGINIENPSRNPLSLQTILANHFGMYRRYLRSREHVGITDIMQELSVPAEAYKGYKPVVDQIKTAVKKRIMSGELGNGISFRFLGEGDYGKAYLVTTPEIKYIVKINKTDTIAKTTPQLTTLEQAYVLQKASPIPEAVRLIAYSTRDRCLIIEYAGQISLANLANQGHDLSKQTIASLQAVLLRFTSIGIKQDTRLEHVFLSPNGTWKMIDFYDNDQYGSEPAEESAAFELEELTQMYKTAGGKVEE